MIKLPIQKIIIFLGAMSVLMLIAYNTKDIFFGTKFLVKSVPDGSTINDTFLPISGIAKHASSLEINGRSISINTKGIFDDSVLLSPGYNIVEIKQKDRFGKEQTKTLHLVAQPTSAVVTAMQINYQ